MTTERGRQIREQLPPGLDRRLALVEADEQITLSDFTGEERAGLLADLAELRASVRAGTRHP